MDTANTQPNIEQIALEIRQEMERYNQSKTVYLNVSKMLHKISTQCVAVEEAIKTKTTYLKALLDLYENMTHLPAVNSALPMGKMYMDPNCPENILSYQQGNDGML